MKNESLLLALMHSMLVHGVERNTALNILREVHARMEMEKFEQKLFQIEELYDSGH